MSAKRSARWVTISFCIVAIGSLGHAEENTPPEGFKVLFNGKDLAGWHGMGHFDPRQEAVMQQTKNKKNQT